MASITMYKAVSYNNENRKLFSGVYNDFRNRALSDYNFELQPLTYDKFIESIEKGLLECILLTEDNIPTGFLVYTTIISEAIELNIIHCIGNENINEKRKLLLEKFLEITKPLLKNKIVTYPMLGKQSSFSEEIKNYGFKTVNTAVNVFNPQDSDIASISEENEKLPGNFSITNWKSHYDKDIIEVILQSFKDSSDSLFDSRFSSELGCKDILNKITQNVYGEFLPDATKILLCGNTPVGFCFVNLTNDKIANIPLIGILRKHQGFGFGKILLQSAIKDIQTAAVKSGHSPIILNATCDADNAHVMNMYASSGFTVSYSYAQAYLPKHSD